VFVQLTIDPLLSPKPKNALLLANVLVLPVFVLASAVLSESLLARPNVTSPLRFTDLDCF